MTGYQRIKAHMRLCPPDRIGLFESMAWAETYQRWEAEGYPRGVHIWDYFDFDLRRIHLYPTFNLRDILLEDLGDGELRRGPSGEIYRVKKGIRSDASGIQHVGYMITTRADWEAHKHRLGVGEDRFGDYWREQYAEARAKGLYVMLSTRQPLWAAANKVGLVRFMELMHDDADWMHEMVRAHLQFILDAVKVAERLEMPVDCVYMTNGTTMKHGSLISPQAYWEFGAAYDRLLTDEMAERDIEVMLHFDGNFSQLLDATVRSGVHGLAMIEVRAGMDVIALKRIVGDKFCFMGNISVDALSSGDREVIEHEVRSKVAAAMPGGGYIFHSDGSIPPTVSFESYEFAYNLAKRIGWYG